MKCKKLKAYYFLNLYVQDIIVYHHSTEEFTLVGFLYEMLILFVFVLGGGGVLLMRVVMTSPGNYMIKAVLSLDQTPQMPETQTLQQPDYALVVKVIRCWV